MPDTDTHDILHPISPSSPSFRFRTFIEKIRISSAFCSEGLASTWAVPGKLNPTLALTLL